MNVSELARQLKIHPQKLLQILPEFGFDIGARAVKIDDRVAQQVIRSWKRIKYAMEQKDRAEKEKQKELEKEMRRETGATIKVPNKLTVKEFAGLMQVPVNKLIVELMKNGILAGQNENIDHDTAVIVAEEMGFQVEDGAGINSVIETTEHVEKLESILSQNATVIRAPVIVVMGHVDHGKTKLLDAIRSTDVVAGEAGGITQHIGAYQVVWANPNTKEKRKITFIDTPGHEAFTVMRSRGAKVADIAILVVAADDGVKPQTVEAINIIKAAKLPTVVAINKIDKEGADAERVRNELAQHNIISEAWGGDTPMVEISAKQNLNIDKLLDNLLVVADVHENTIKADPDRAPAGTVIEARVDKGEGPVATILVQTGTLKANDPLVINGQIYGKVRAMKNYLGEPILTAGPSTPVRILGFKVAPQVGDVLDLSQAGSAVQVDLRAKRNQQTGAEQKVLSSNTEGDEEAKKTLNLVVKADVLGSLEAIIGSVEKLKNEEVSVKIVGKGLGNITADDVTLAETTGAQVFAFNVVASPVADQMIRDRNVEFHQYKVIYDLFDKVKEDLTKLLNPEKITTELGVFTVKAIFRTEKNFMIVGGSVDDGKLLKDCKVRVKQKGQLVGQGKLSELQVGKQTMNEIPAGTECGVHFDGKLKLEVGDRLEAYKEETKERKLELS
ncbi:MAG TPA: translation initiation factor IF-2 [Patescibacteria group bacterium]|nr:translation initiation factor IF-2 [Patescibacteria group bacterium]